MNAKQANTDKKSLCVLDDFHYRHVFLAPGHWEKQREHIIDLYLNLPERDLLQYFRNRAGISRAAGGLTGWYGNGASTFGQILGALAKLYLETGDERIRIKAETLADGWGECAHASESIYSHIGTYVFDKLITGFLDLYEYLHYEQAAEYVDLLTERAEMEFDRSIPRDGLQVMPGGMIEWYTLPEQLYRAYDLLGNVRCLRMAKEWDYPYYWNKLLAGDYHIGPRHAYSHVNALSSAARAYLQTGKTGYLKAIENAYDEITAHHIFATGGYGPAECIFPDEEGYLSDSIKSAWDPTKRHREYINFSARQVSRDDRWGSCEVSCCAWAVFKICSYLLKITGEARYGDWAEKMLINGCGGQLPITEEGEVMYYADYFVDGGLKTVKDGRLMENGANFEWQCCTGTFPEDVAEYSNMLYYRNSNGDIFVAQYLPSVLSFNAEGHNWVLKNVSNYPKEKEIRIILTNDDRQPVSGELRLHFRVPSWAGPKSTVYVNGHAIKTPILPNQWLEVQVQGEKTEIRLDFEFCLAFRPADQYDTSLVALNYGPLTLVCNKMSVLSGDTAHPEEWIVPVCKEGYSFAFETKPGHVLPYEWIKRSFYPYYEVPEMQWYYMYNRIRRDN